MQNKDSKIRTTISKNIINSNQKIYKKTSEKSEVFELFALSSSAVPLYADELEMTKSASFSTALTSLSILYRQAEPSRMNREGIFSITVSSFVSKRAIRQKREGKRRIQAPTRYEEIHLQYHRSARRALIQRRARREVHRLSS